MRSVNPFSVAILATIASLANGWLVDDGRGLDLGGTSGSSFHASESDGLLEKVKKKFSGQLIQGVLCYTLSQRYAEIVQ
jgi:hypothetical protein